MEISPIIQSLPVKLALDTAFTTYLAHSVRVIPSTIFPARPEQVALGLLYGSTLCLSQSVDKNDRFLVSIYKITKVVFVATACVALIFRASHHYNYFPFKQCFAYATYFSAIFSILNQVTLYVVSSLTQYLQEERSNPDSHIALRRSSPFNDSEFDHSELEEDKLRPFYRQDSKRRDTAPPSYTSATAPSYFSSSQANEGLYPVLNPVDSLLNASPTEIKQHYHDYMEKELDIYPIVSLIRKRLIDYTAHSPQDVFDLLEFFLQINKGAVSDFDMTYLICWLIDHGIVVTSVFDSLNSQEDLASKSFELMGKILEEISQKPPEDLEALLKDPSIRKSYYQLLLTLRNGRAFLNNEAFQTLPINIQVILNKAFFEEEQISKCHDFSIEAINSTLGNIAAESDELLLRVLHQQLCDRRNLLQHIKGDPEGPRRALKDKFTSLGLKYEHNSTFK